MRTVAVSELRNNLMSLIKKVQAGENIIVTSRGHEVAKLVTADKVMRFSNEVDTVW